MSRPPRVVLVAPRSPGEGFGGAERHLVDLGTVLESLGATVRFVALRDAPRPSLAARAAVRAWPLLASPIASRSLRNHPDIVGADLVLSIELMGVGLRHRRHLHLFFGSYAGFRTSALPPVQGMPSVVRRLVTRLATALERRTHGPLGALANSVGLRDALERAGVPVLAQVVPPPTDTDLFSPGHQADARARLGLPDTSRLLLFAGRWEYAKGADRVTALTARMPEGWRLMVAAPSSHAPSDLPTGALLRTDLSQPSMVDAYRAADVLIQPSRFEGYSLVVSEAQACACPVLSSDVGHASHLAAGPPAVAAGVVSEPDDAQAWLDALDRVAGDSGRLDAARVAARNFATGTVSRTAVARDWHRLLIRIAPELSWQFPA
jgi:glycosyltransferase involved in cell wall biosynthesis